MASESASKKQAGEHLKSADRLLKSGDMVGALEEVEKALALDPSNFYARAYKIRLLDSKDKGIHSEKLIHPPAAEKAAASHAHTPSHQHPAVKKPEQPKPVPEKLDRELLEEARKQAEEEIRRRMVELEAMQKHIEEQRIKIEQDRGKLMEAQRKLVEDFHRKELEFQKSMEDQRRTFEDERKGLQADLQLKDSDSHRKLEEEAKKVAELRRKLEGEVAARERAAQQAIDDARKKIEEEAMRHSEIARRTLEDERQKLAVDRKRMDDELRLKEETLRAKFEDERKRLEIDLFRRAEETSRLKLESEIRRRLDEESSKRQKEEEFLRAAREEGVRQAQAAKAKEHFFRAQKLYAERAFDEALTEITRVFLIVPEHSDARVLEESIRKERKEVWRRELDGARSEPRQKATDVYRRALRKAWSNAPLSSSEQMIMENLRQSLNIQLDEHAHIEFDAKREAYADAIRDAFASGTPSRPPLERLESLRRELGITEEEHAALMQSSVARNP